MGHVWLGQLHQAQQGCLQLVQAVVVGLGHLTGCPGKAQEPVRHVLKHPDVDGTVQIAELARQHDAVVKERV